MVPLPACVVSDATGGNPMCEGLSCGAMMWGGWLIGALAIVALLLGAAALVKYLRSK